MPELVGFQTMVILDPYGMTFLGLSTLEKFKITLEQIIQTVKGQDNYGNIFFQSGFFYPNFSTLQRNNEIPNQSNSLGLRKNSE